MRFKAGMLGVCAVVLAILGTIVLGTVTAVEETSDTRTGYRTVADVTGLVNTDKDPYFTDYNPSKNWTGYYLDGTDSTYISGVDFTTTTQANNYPLYENNPVTTTGSLNLDSLGDEAKINPGYSDVRDFTSTIGDGRPYRHDMSMTTLTNVVNTIKTKTTTSITFNAGTMGINPTRAYFSPQSNNATSPFSPMAGQSLGDYFGMYWWHADVSTTNITQSRVLEGAVSIDIQNMTASFTDVSQTYYPQYYNVPTDYILVIWGGTGVEGTTTNNVTYTPNAIPSTITYSKTDSNIQYMDVSKGVKLNNYGTGVNTLWENGYTNGSLDMILKGSAGKIITTSINVKSWDGDNWTGGSTFVTTIEWTNVPSYRTIITLSGNSVNIGGWNNVKLHFDMEAGELIAEPITYFGSYTTYTTSAPVRIGDIPSGAFDKITFSALSTGTAPDMEIIGTRVYMNTYGAVFRNASLNVSTYFPDVPRYAVSFGNYALTGDSFTVNGVSLPVSDKTFTYDGKTYPLQGASIVYYDDVKIEGDGYSIDLGDLVNSSIFFSGVWYMPIFFKEAYEYTESAYNWIPYGFGLDYNASILAFIGISLGILLLASTFKVKPKALDWVVIVFSGFIAVGLLVV